MASFCIERPPRARAKERRPRRLIAPVIALLSLSISSAKTQTSSRRGCAPRAIEVAVPRRREEIDCRFVVRAGSQVSQAKRAPGRSATPRHHPFEPRFDVIMLTSLSGAEGRSFGREGHSEWTRLALRAKSRPPTARKRFSASAARRVEAATSNSTYGNFVGSGNDPPPRRYETIPSLSFWSALTHFMLTSPLVAPLH